MLLGACLVLIALAGCREKPMYRVGDYLSPIGNSDPSQIIKVLAVNRDSYWIAENPLQPKQINYLTRKRGEIDGRYVLVELADFDRTKNPPKSSPPPISPTPTPTATPTPSVSPASTPTPQPQPTIDNAHTLDLAKLSGPIRPAVVQISVFDASGKLLRSGTGFFVSDDGRVVTTWRVVEGGLNAVIKRGDGAIYNVTGVLAGSAALDLAILKAESPRADSLPIRRSPTPEAGTHLAVIGSELARKEGEPLEAAVSAKRSDARGDLVEINATIPRGSAGAPVVNANGEVVGIATSASDKTESAGSVRLTSAVASMLAGITPAAVPGWPAKANSAGLFVAKPKPSPTPHEPRLLSAPLPAYPALSQFFSQSTATGRFNVQFGADGNVVSVQVVQSTRNQALDNAAIEALRRWRSEPGRPWQKSVPITFNRPTR